ncbi:MAG: tetratricopeptide repeat protein, partial [Magnetococcales bacterium]|nr:tetratricopeptide repeat protein [Magnetococcales bacterium]
ALHKAISFHSVGQLDEAIHWYKKTLEINPVDTTSLSNMGAALQSQGRQEEAIACYQKAIAIKPDYANAYSNLGVTLLEQGKLVEAISLLKKATAIKPDYAEAFSNLGNAQRKHGELEDAIYSCKKAIAIKPDYAEAFSNLGSCLKEQDKLDEAISCFVKAITFKPDYAEAYSNLGVALHEQGKFAEAIIKYQKAIAILPNYAEAYSNLGFSLQEQGELDESVRILQQAIAIKPNYAEAYSNLGVTFQDLGKFDDAIKCFKKGIALKPDFTHCHNQLICCLDMYVDVSDEQPYTERKKWAEQHATPLQVHWSTFTNIPDPTKKLRIGYVGADFKHHSAAHIFGPMLLNFDAEQFQIFCYAGNTLEDDLTEQFKEKSTRWLQTSRMDDEALAKEIKNDGIDILVDLAGHTIGNRLLTFARKPAPIQINAWGYPFGTAMEAMDYIFADPFFIPHSEHNKYTEQIINIPCVIHMQKVNTFPDVTDPPSCQNGYITFGAFNRLKKYNDSLFTLWAEILRHIPTAKLIFKTPKLDSSMQVKKIQVFFMSLGISKSRLIFIGKTSRYDHLKAHEQIDIMLDPFPHNSGMTALEALRMGVPVLNCETKIRGPISSTMLNILGIDEWRTKSEEEYVAKAVLFASDIKLLKTIRHQLRNRFDNSVLGNSQLYTQEVEAVYRKIWKKWCATQ